MALPRLQVLGCILAVFTYSSLAPAETLPAKTTKSSHTKRQSSKAKRPQVNLQADFSPEERALLVDKKLVKRQFRLTVNKREYRAGLSYRLVQATPMDVMRALRRPDGIVRAIPYGIEAKTLSEHNGVAQVKIVQGKSPIVGGYTVRLEWDLSEYQARFWMDPNEDHDIQDIWGTFSAREVMPGWTLVSFSFCFDIGGVGEILASKAHRWALSTANRIAGLVEPEQSEAPKED